MTIKFGEKTDVTISSGTNKILFDGTGAIGLGGANYGNPSQVLTSNGSGSAVSWENQIDTTYTGSTSVTINNANQISIGQDVNISADVAFRSLNIQKDYSIFPITEPIISFTDNQAGGILGTIEGVAEVGGGGDLIFKTRNTSGTIVEHLRIQQSGLVSVKTDGTGLLIASQDGVTEQGFIYNSGFGTKDFVIDAQVGSLAKGIAFRTGGNDRLKIGNNGQLGIGGAVYGNDGDVLTSKGPTLPPIWTAPSSSPTVYGRCILAADQPAPDQNVGGGGVIVENWTADPWSVGFSVGGINSREITVTTAGVYRYDLIMAGTYTGSPNNGIEFQLRDGAGTDLVGWASYNGEGSRATGNISGLLNVTNANAGFRVYGYMNAGGTGTWDAGLHGVGCSLSLQLVA